MVIVHVNRNNVKERGICIIYIMYNYIYVPKFRSCHKAIVVITREGTLLYVLYISLTAHAV